jgi:hypothetical protein
MISFPFVNIGFLSLVCDSCPCHGFVIAALVWHFVLLDAFFFSVCHHCYCSWMWHLAAPRNSSYSNVEEKILTTTMMMPSPSHFVSLAAEFFLHLMCCQGEKITLTRLA